MNSWHRAPYIYDKGLVEAADPDDVDDDGAGGGNSIEFSTRHSSMSKLMPSLAEIMAGATPGFRAAPSSSNGSVISNYRRLGHNFIVGSYNVYDNMETDDASSRYLHYSSYLLYGKVIINRSARLLYLHTVRPCQLFSSCLAKSQWT